LKRKFLQEMFNEDTVILSASGKEIPSLNKIFEIYLGFKGIEVQYNGQFIIFSYGINMII